MSKPNLKEIEWAISELEGEESSRAGYILRAALYTCRNEMIGVAGAQPQTAAYSEEAKHTQESLGQYGDSEFLRAVSGKDPGAAWRVMDELMETLGALNAKAYNSVMRKISEL